MHRIKVLSLFVIFPILVGCTASKSDVAVKEGDTVKIHYTGKLEDGEVFNSGVCRLVFATPTEL